MKFINKRTTDLTLREKQQICELFLDVFEKEKKLDEFEQQFSNTCKGYSYHGLVVDDNGDIIGCYSSIPYEYNYYGNKVVFSLSVDTMIKESHRGNPFLLKKLSNALYEEMKSDGIVFVFGFPNENIYLIRKKLLKWKDIDLLDFYIQPIRLGNVKPVLKPFNFLSLLYSGFINSNFLLSLSKQKVENRGIVKINDEKFHRQRYTEEHFIVEDDNKTIVYNLSTFENAQVAYLVDVSPLSKENLEQAVKYIKTRHYKEIDIIIYIGNIEYTPVNLIKVPKKFHPKKIYMSGRILDKKIIDDRVFDTSNWEVNLSNFDVV